MGKLPKRDDELLNLIAKHRKIYDRIGIVRCPLMKNQGIRFNIVGFRHLHVDGKGKYRTKSAAKSRLELMQYATNVVQHSKMIKTNKYTAQETYSKKNEIYHNLFSKVGPFQVRVMVTIRVIGGGDPHFYGIRRN